MKTIAFLATAFASLVVNGCAPPEARLDLRAPSPTWRDTGTPPSSVVDREPERRYYTDHSGAIWNDRGKRVAPGP